MSSKNPFGLLARLFNWTDNGVITQLYTHALGQPLLVEPRLGEQCIAAYMAGAVDSSMPRQSEVGKIAVLNISGALVNRPMPGPSGEGPANYESMSATFERLVDDVGIDAIVLRMDSPGGMASGVFDFSDRIFAARDRKPVIAVVDDMAYSAAYAIAAASSEIWVSRTGGVGSVGVIAYHVEQSERDKRKGYKVTHIHAGARKVDFSPHMPLSEEAFNIEQAVVNGLYDLFVDRVGSYRAELGLTADAARKSEAGLFAGQAAIDAGFADQLGTLQDALRSLSTRLSQPKQIPETSQAMNDQEQLAHDRGLISAAVLAADLSGDVVKALLARTDIKVDTVAQAIADAGKIAELCKTAGMPERALAYISKGDGVEAARADLIQRKAAEDEARQTDPTLQPNLKSGTGRAPTAWDKVITRLGGKL